MDRNYYNNEIVKSDGSQLLLNIVRLRHLDTITFLQINSITAQKTVQSTGSGNFSFNPSAGGSLGSFLGGAFSYSDTPTVSFTPLQGADFVNNLVVTVSLKSIYHLIHSAWNIEVILKLALHQINDDYNEVGFVAREHNRSPHGYHSFLRILHLLKELQQHSALKLDLRQKTEDERELFFIFDKTRELAVTAELKRLLHISPNAPHMIWTSQYYEHMPKDTVYVRTRSIMQMMSYLANAVILPPKDPPFQGFYAFRVPGLTIYSSPVPTKVSIQAVYRGNYYYIKDDDSSSKLFFILFNSFYQLTAGLAGGTSGVALTLPVGK